MQNRAKAWRKVAQQLINITAHTGIHAHPDVQQILREANRLISLDNDDESRCIIVDGDGSTC